MCFVSCVFCHLCEWLLQHINLPLGMANVFSLSNCCTARSALSDTMGDVIPNLLGNILAAVLPREHDIAYCGPVAVDP